MYFQINVTPTGQKPSAKAKETPEPQAILVLAPFQPQPRLKIESSVDVPAQTSLIVRNISNRSLVVKLTKVPPPERRITLSSTEITVPASSEESIILSWRPQEPGSWRDTLQLTDSRRLKYDVPLATLCTEPKRNQKGSRGGRGQKVLVPSNNNTVPRVESTVGPIKTVPTAENGENVRKSQGNQQNHGIQPKIEINQGISQNGIKNERFPQTNQQRIENFGHYYGIPENSLRNPGIQQNYGAPQRIPENGTRINGIHERNENHMGNNRAPQDFSRTPETTWKTSPKPSQNIEISGVFDISSYELTPLKPNKITDKPAIQIKEEPNGQGFHFSPRDTQIMSPDDQPHLRRDTYLNTAPRYCKLPEPVKSANEEDFDDSLSPRPGVNKLSNFSQIMENLATFQTPQKSEYHSVNNAQTVKQSPNCEVQNVGNNNTFEINRSGEMLGFGTPTGLINVKQEFREMDGRIKQEFQQQHSNSRDNVDFINKNQQFTMDNGISSLERDNYGLSSNLRVCRQYPQVPPGNSQYHEGNRIHHFSTESLNLPLDSRQFSSTSSLKDSREQLQEYAFLAPPVPPTIYRSTESLLQSSKMSKTFDASTPLSISLRNGDHSSVKQVIEANLWLQGDPPPRHHISFSCESLPSTPFKRQPSAPTLNLTKTLTSPPKPTTFDISPVKKSQQMTKPLKNTQIYRISPRKPAKIIKNTKETQKVNNILKSTKLTLNSQKTLPVRIGKLSLAKLHKKKTPAKEPVVKLHTSNFLTARLANLDPFAAATSDPFLTTTMYYDEQWMYNQELEFKKWLNALLTPPENLSADVDTVRVDVGKVWQSCRGKDSIPLAETREAVSARYHTNHRLNTLRKQALAMYARPEVGAALSRTIGSVEKGVKLVIREDRDLHRDIGLQKEILELFLSYNPLWLRIGLEVVYGETIPLHSNNDLVGLTKFLLRRFFSDPFLVEKYSHPNSNIKTPEFMPHLNKSILKKFLLLVFFLDYAKRNRLIGHNPCLFHKKAVYKESREILLNFARQTLKGVGDFTKILKSYGYEVSHKQTYLDEFDYAVEDLAVDLRDGVRLCRVMELIIGDINLISKCRVPAISRLQKIHNADMALSALKAAGYVIAGEIDAKAVVEGHREKTLSLLWQIIYKFEAPRFDKAARVLQKWWHSQLWFIRTRNYVRERKNNSALVIQCAWRCYKARQVAGALKKEMNEIIKKKTRVAVAVQTWWRARYARMRFLKLVSSVIMIQRAWRRYRTSRPYLQELQRKKDAAISIQRFWRSWRIVQIERSRFLLTIGAVLIIQAKIRAVLQGRHDRARYQQMKKSAVAVQRRWRAKKIGDVDRRNYMEIIGKVKIIQRWWRSLILTRRIRNEFIINKHSVKVVEDWYLGVKLMESERKEFLRKKRSAEVVQRTWRRFAETRGPIGEMKAALRAVVNIQTWYRAMGEKRNYRKLQKSVILIQNWYRSVKSTEKIRENYVALKKAAVLVQKIWKMKQQRRNYLRMKKAVGNIENWYSGIKMGRQVRLEFLKKRNAAVCIQKWWQGVRLMEKNQQEFLTLRATTVRIQKSWRMKILTRKIRNEFLELKRHVLIVQTTWRGILSRRQFVEMQRRHRAAVLIQQRFRARKSGLAVRKQFLVYKNAAIVIQRQFRAQKSMTIARSSFLNLKKSAIIIQHRYRAQKSMIIARDSYLNMRKSIILIQSLWRRRKALTTYEELKKSIIFIQKSWRSLISTRKQRNEFLALKKSVIFVQRKVRANFKCQKARTDYLRLKMMTIIIQRVWRKKLEDREREEATICIQAWWRLLLETRKTQRDYQDLKKSAIVIQTHFRAFSLARQVRKEFERRRSAARVIQRAWRRFAARQWRQQQLENRQKSVKILEKWWICVQMKRREALAASELLNRQNRAAALIQASWRGFMVRRRECERVKKLRLRAQCAAKEAQPSTTVAYRLEMQMQGLMNPTNIGQLTMTLATIDTLTRLSIKGCVVFCQRNFVEEIYDLFERSNRSLPWMDVCIRSTNILITLAKLPETVAYVRKLEYMETVARMMSFSIKGQQELFLNLATLLWVLTDNDDFRVAVVEDQRTAWLVKNICSAAVKNRLVKKNGKCTSGEIILPNMKPDWGFRGERPRCFVKVEHAVLAIVDRFEINLAKV